MNRIYLILIVSAGLISTSLFSASNKTILSSAYDTFTKAKSFKMNDLFDCASKATKPKK